MGCCDRPVYGFRVCNTYRKEETVYLWVMMTLGKDSSIVNIPYASIPMGPVFGSMKSS